MQSYTGLKSRQTLANREESIYEATLRACGELETQAGRLRQLVDSFKI